jgi:hypothetical protein
MQFKNPFNEEGSWYKANLHCHTTESDGILTPSERVEAYRAKGYSILAITDHGAVTDVRGLGSEDFLVIPGVEGHPYMDDTIYFHIVALNVPNDFGFGEEEAPQDFISRANAAGGVVFHAHPYWLGLSADEILKLNGAVGVEVFNAVCGSKGKSTSSVHWDDLLQRGAKTVGIAVDDAHGDKDDVFRGWTWLKLKELSIENVMIALRDGCFYSSTGPEIKDIELDAGRIRARCSPVWSIAFVAERWHGSRSLAEEGQSVTEAEHQITGDEKYVRVECTDPRGRKAWSNPFFF